MFRKKQCLIAAGIASLIASVPAAQAQEREIEELIVIGSTTPIDRFKLGSALTVLSAEDIENSGALYISDALRHVPGLAVSRTGAGGGLTSVRIRGAEANHVLVIVDGIEVNDADGNFDFSSLVASNIDRIEILRGPQSGLYGSNATAGVINIITKSGSGGSGVSVLVEAGSLDNHKQSIQLMGNRGIANGALNITRQESSFDASDLGSEDDDDENLTINGQGTIKISESFSLDGAFRVIDKTSDIDDYDFSGGPLQGLAIDSAGVSQRDEYGINIAANFTLFDGRSINKLSIARTDTETEGSSTGSTPTFGNDNSRDKIALQTTLLFGQNGGLNHQGSFFIEREKEEYRNAFPSSPAQGVQLDRTLVSYGVEYRADINENLFLSASIREDNNDKFEDVNTYRLTAAYLLSDQTRFHASVATGVTNPSFGEQFGFNPGRYQGNPNLNPEKSEGWDLGVEQKFLDGGLVIDLTYFDANLEDEIASSFDAAAGLSTPINSVDDSDREGVEIGFTLNSIENLSVAGSYTYTDAVEGSDREVRRPEHTGSLDATYRFMDQKARISLSTVYNGEMLDSDFRNYFVTFSAERTKLDSYVLVNLTGSYQFNNGIELYGSLNNLFDEDYEEVISYGTPGAHGTVGIRYSF